jgi:hypothetical protein
MSIKDTLTNNSMNSFSFGGKTYTRRVDNGAVVYDISAGTDGSAFSTGWVNTDGTTAVADGATLTFNHNLGTTDFVIQIWVSHDSLGSNAYQIFTDSAASSAGSKMDGAIIDNISETQLSLQLGAGGFFNVSSSGTWSKESWASKYVKVVVSAKMGSGGGGGTPAGSDRQLQFNDNGAFGANVNLKFDGSNLFAPGMIVGSGIVSGNEGGEMAFEKAPNSTLGGSYVHFDQCENRLRFFEGASPFRGAYLDLTECADVVGTNLLAGGGGGGSSGGNFDSGWLEVPNYAAGSSDNYADLSISHMLGNKYPVVQVYIQDVSTGKEQNIGLQSDEWSVSTDSGVHYNPIDSNTGTIRIFEKILGESAATPGELNYLNIVGNTAYRIKIIASGGGGGSGPRAYVEFDGTASNMTTELSASNSFNVSSITDHQAGQYTVTFTSPVPNPVAFHDNSERSDGHPILYSDLYNVGNNSIKIGLGSNNLWYDSAYISLIVF